MQPLKLISSDFQKARDAMILRPIKTLETINDKAEDEFWKEVKNGMNSFLPRSNQGGARQEPPGRNRPSAFTLCYKVSGPTALPPRFEPVDLRERYEND